MDQCPVTMEPVGSNSVSAALASSGCEWRYVPFDREGWEGQFPNASVSTPLGEVEIAPERIEMPDVGLSLIGLIRPVLENPTYAVKRDNSLAFHRPVIGTEGEVRGYATVNIHPDRVRVYVAEQPEDFDLLSPDATGSMVADEDGDGRATFKSFIYRHGGNGDNALGGNSGGGNEPIVAVTSFDVAVTLLGIGGDLLKADHGPIPADARWITVHPNGEGSKGQPILVVPAGDKSGTFRVIGGAGGKLNMMKLRGVKSEADYKAEFGARAKARRVSKKEQARKDKELGIDKAKAEARDAIRKQRTEAQKAFIKTVAEAMGWGDDDLKMQTNGLSETAVKKAEAAHHADLLAKAKAAIETQRKILVTDLDKRLAAGLGTVPLDAPMSELSVQDLDPVRIPDSSGVSPDFKARAEANGLTPEKLDSEQAKVQAQEAGEAPDPAKALERGKVAEAIRKEVAKALPKPDLQVSIADAKKAVALIKARKQLLALEKAAREANAEVDASTVEPKAYVLKVSETGDDEVAAQVVDDLRTARAAAFLAGVEGAGGENEVQPHISAGAYNAINALSQITGGASLIDRSVVDVLGVAGAAQVVANRLHAEYGGDAQKVAAGLAEYHVASAPEDQKAALDQAKELQDEAAKIEVDEANSTADLAVASALNRKRLEYLADARKVLGQTLGHMEANASLIAALEAGPRDGLEVSLGRTPLESAIKQLWAIGLTDDDYSIERIDGNVFAKVNADGMAKLAAPVDKENLERVNRNLGIMQGDQDEDDWLPAGFARRPDLGLDLKPGVAPGLSVPFDASAPDLAASLRAYIGSRTADGDRAADVLSDVQSASFFQKVGPGRAKEYMAALNAVIPTKNGKSLTRVEELAPVFDGYADEFVQSKWGGTRSTLNKQSFEPDAIAQEALHRALSDEPAGTLAYKPIGELSPKDRHALRDWFYRNIAKESPEQAELRAHAEKLAEQEPEKFTTDMFGDTTANPAWNDWKAEYDAAQGKVNDASLDWNRYSKMLRGNVRALETVQDLIRSRVSENFAKHHNTLRPNAALKVGTTVVRNNLNHLSATDPVEREKRLSMERSLIDGLRARIKGKYAGGSVADKIEATKAYEAAFNQAQMGFFASDDLFGGEGGEKPLGGDERRTIGHAAENMIGKMMGVVGGQFKPGQPVKLFNPSMSGKGVNRQRAIKMIGQNKRVILAAGVGSGKTGMMMGAFSDLHSKGQAKKGLFVVPSIVQGQFGAEALRFLEPGKFKWHAEPGASYQERLAAYKDPDTHFSVVTHQSFRDDVLRMAVDAGMGKSPEAVADALAGMDDAGQAKFVKSVLDHHGVAFDFTAADEAHNLLDREGKEDSRMSNVIGGVTANAPYYVHASGDPVKNDASEAFSLLQKMDPARYNDRGAFMRRYGGDTLAAKEGLQRELARHQFSFSLSPDVKVDRSEVSIKPSDAQQAALATLEKQAAALRIAKMTGKVDVDAAKALSPHLFEGADEGQHEAIARKVADSVGIIKQSAYRRILDAHPAAAKLSHVAEAAAARKGKPGVVFAHSLEAVEAIRKRLEADGHRVTTLTGKDSSGDKADKIRAFNPDKGEAKADIIVCSDAGATGANLQSGRWLVQYDTPDTAMVHAQRAGRINRIGQKNALELIDLVSDHPSDARARRRLANKYDLRELLTSPLDGLDDTPLAYALKQAGFGQSKQQASLF